MTAPTEDQIRECMLHLEALIGAMKTKFSPDDIMKFVHLVINGHIKDGAFTEEYIQFAQNAQTMRQQWKEEEANPAQKIILTGFAPKE